MQCACVAYVKAIIYILTTANGLCDSDNFILCCFFSFLSNANENKKLPVKVHKTETNKRKLKNKKNKLDRLNEWNTQFFLFPILCHSIHSFMWFASICSSFFSVLFPFQLSTCDPNRKKF